jgi:hypothetical protein
MVWKGLLGIAGKLDKIYIMKCSKYMYGNKIIKIWDSYLPCIAMAHSPQVKCMQDKSEQSTNGRPFH